MDNNDMPRMTFQLSPPRKPPPASKIPKRQKKATACAPDPKANPLSSTEATNKLYETLKNDPVAKRMVLDFLKENKQQIEAYERKELASGSKSPLNRVKTPKPVRFESPTALLRRRALENNKKIRLQFDSAGDNRENVVPVAAAGSSGKKIPRHKLLQDVIAFVEVKSGSVDRSLIIKQLVISLGASVSEKLNKRVTHVIYKDGSYETYKTSKRLKLPIVSLFWLDIIIRTGVREPVAKHPPLNVDATKVCEDLCNAKYANQRRFSSSTLTNSCSNRTNLNHPKIMTSYTSPRNDDDLSIIELRSGSSTYSNSNVHLPAGNISESDIDDVIAGSQTSLHALPVTSRITMRRNTGRAGRSSPICDFATSNESNDIDKDCNSATDIESDSNSDANSTAPVIDGSPCSKTQYELETSRKLDESLQLVALSDQVEKQPSEIPKSRKTLLVAAELGLLSDDDDFLHEISKSIPKQPESITFRKSRKTIHATQEMELTGLDSDVDTRENRPINRVTDYKLTDMDVSSEISESPRRVTRRMTMFHKGNEIKTKVDKTPHKESTSVVNKDETTKSKRTTTSSTRTSTSDNLAAYNTPSKSAEKQPEMSRKTSLVSAELDLLSDDDEFFQKTPGSNTSRKSQKAIHATQEMELTDLDSDGDTRESRPTKLTATDFSSEISDSTRRVTRRMTMFQKENEINTKVDKTPHKESTSVVNTDETTKSKRTTTSSTRTSTSDNLAAYKTLPKSAKKQPENSPKRLFNLSLINNNNIDDEAKSLDLSLRLSDSTKSTKSQTKTTDAADLYSTMSTTSSSVSEISSIYGNENCAAENVMSNLPTTPERVPETSKRLSRSATKCESSRFFKELIAKRTHSPSSESSSLDTATNRGNIQVEVEVHEPQTPERSQKHSENRRITRSVTKRKTPPNTIEASPMGSLSKQLTSLAMTPSKKRKTRRSLMSSKSGEKTASTAYSFMTNQNHTATEPEAPEASSNLMETHTQNLMTQTQNTRSKRKLCCPDDVSQQISASDEDGERRARVLAQNSTTRKLISEKLSGLNIPAPAAPAETHLQGRTQSPIRTQARTLSPLCTDDFVELIQYGTQKEFLERKAAQRSQWLQTQRSQKPPKKMYIVCTRFHREQNLEFRNIYKKLGGDVNDMDINVNKRTTHLVSMEPIRTLNILRAMSRGIWILNKSWLFDSDKAGKWLPEDDYELTEFSPHVQRLRIEREAFGRKFVHGVFASCETMYVAPNSHPSKGELIGLIRLCKGKVTEDRDEANILIGVPNCNREGQFCVNEKWILDCITFSRPKKMAPYLLSAF